MEQVRFDDWYAPWPEPGAGSSFLVPILVGLACVVAVFFGLWWLYVSKKHVSVNVNQGEEKDQINFYSAVLLHDCAQRGELDSSVQDAYEALRDRATKVCFAREQVEKDLFVQDCKFFATLREKLEKHSS